MPFAVRFLRWVTVLSLLRDFSARRVVKKGKAATASSLSAEEEASLRGTLSEAAFLNASSFATKASGTLSEAELQLLRDVPDQMRKVVQQATANPAETAGIVFTALLVIYFLKICSVDLPEVASAAEKRDASLKEFDATVEQDFNAIFSTLEVLQSEAIVNSEKHFREKFRGMIKFLRLFGHFDSKADNKVAWPDCFREFMTMWLAAFHNCSLDPEHDPLILVPAEQLQKAQTVRDIAKIVVEESKPMFEKFPSAAQKVHEAKGLRESISEERDALAKSTSATACTCTSLAWERHGKAAFPADLHLCFVRVTVSSSWQLRLFFVWLVGISLASLLFIKGSIYVGAAVSVSLKLQLLTLWWSRAIHENHAQQGELEKCLQKQADVKSLRAKLEPWEEQYARVVNLWQYQTVNHLDLLDEIKNLTARIMLGKQSTGKQADHFAKLSSAYKKAKVVGQGMGSTSLYMAGPAAIDEDFLDFASSEMRGSIGSVGEAVDKCDLVSLEQHLDNFFCFLVIKVCDVRKLPATSFTGAGGFLRSRVMVKLGQLESCTEEATDHAPVWEEEMCLAVPMGEDKLSLVLQDVEKQQDLASVSVPFRGDAGNWMSREMKMKDANGAQMDAVLKFEVLYGNSLNDFAAQRYQHRESGRRSKLPKKLASLMSVGAFLRF